MLHRLTAVPMPLIKNLHLVQGRSLLLSVMVWLELQNFTCKGMLSGYSLFSIWLPKLQTPSLIPQLFNVAAACLIVFAIVGICLDAWSPSFSHMRVFELYFAHLLIYMCKVVQQWCICWNRAFSEYLSEIGECTHLYSLRVFLLSYFSMLLLSVRRNSCATKRSSQAGWTEEEVSCFSFLFS